MSRIDEIQASGKDPRERPVRGQKPRAVVVYECQRCPGATKTIIRNRDYVPEALLCSRCTNKIMAKFQ